MIVCDFSGRYKTLLVNFSLFGLLRTILITNSRFLLFKVLKKQTDVTNQGSFKMHFNKQMYFIDCITVGVLCIAERNKDVICYLKISNPEYSSRSNRMVTYLYIVVQYLPTEKQANTKYQIISVNRWKYWFAMTQSEYNIEGSSERCNYQISISIAL